MKHIIKMEPYLWVTKKRRLELCLYYGVGGFPELPISLQQYIDGLKVIYSKDVMLSDSDRDLVIVTPHLTSEQRRELYRIDGLNSIAIPHPILANVQLVLRVEQISVLTNVEIKDEECVCFYSIQRSASIQSLEPSIKDIRYNQEAKLYANDHWANYLLISPDAVWLSLRDVKIKYIEGIPLSLSGNAKGLNKT